jgi:YegS/Rv2252/BmrU family lipid kinase
LQVKSGFILHSISSKKRVLFVVNPRSGTRSKTGLHQLIRQNVPAELFDYQIEFTKAQAHATELAAQAVADNIDYVMAVGGDGTMNEVARSLVHTSTTLGIIPMGSGNGLARDLKIPMAVMSALRLLVEGKRICIDSCTMNNFPFFCTAGAGFDAYIGQCFATHKKRGFQAYVQTTLWEYINYKSESYKLIMPGKTIEKRAFLISFANAAQYGNNAYIAPKADTQDGLFDVCLLRPFPSVQAINMGVKLFNRTLDNSRYLHIWQTKEAILERQAPAPVHIDGEPHMMDEVLTVKIKPQSLNVLVP